MRNKTSLQLLMSIGLLGLTMTPTPAFAQNCVVDIAGWLSAPPPGYHTLVPTVDDGLAVGCNRLSLYVDPGQAVVHQGFTITTNNITVDKYPSPGLIQIEDMMGTNGGHGIYVDGAQNVVIDGDFEVRSTTNQTAVWIDSATMVELRGGLRIRHGENALWILDSTDVTVNVAEIVSADGNGVAIEGSTDVEVSGAIPVFGTGAGFIVSDSTSVRLRGNPGVARMVVSASPSYGTALIVQNNSEVEIEALVLQASETGVQVLHGFGGGATSRTRLVAKETTIQDNQRAGTIRGGYFDSYSATNEHAKCVDAHNPANDDGRAVAEFRLGSGQQPNYVLRNSVDGLRVEGASNLFVDHTIFAGNLRSVPANTETGLLTQSENGQIVARQTLAYDNGQTPQNASIYIAFNNSCKEMFIYSSTFADNETEDVLRPYKDRIARIHLLWSLMYSNNNDGMSCTSGGSDRDLPAAHAKTDHPCFSAGGFPYFGGFTPSSGLDVQLSPNPNVSPTATCPTLPGSGFGEGNWNPSHGTSISFAHSANNVDSGCDMTDLHPVLLSDSRYTVTDPNVTSTRLSLPYPQLHTNLYTLDEFSPTEGASWPDSSQQASAWMAHTMSRTPPADLFPAGTKWTIDGVTAISTSAWRVGYKNPCPSCP